MTFTECLNRYKMHFFIVIVMLVILYAPIVPDMVRDWYNDDNYSHGFIVPLIAAYFLYVKREELFSAEIVPSLSGLILVVAGLLQLLVAWLGVEYFNMRASIVVLLTGFVLFIFGKDVLRVCRFSLFYLILMVPIPYIIYDAVAFPLKLFVTKVSVAFLQLLGVIVLREGNIIMFPTTTLEVADACSGIRSLMSLIALSVAYAYFLKTTTLKRWVIIVSAVPFAIITNALRVIVTGILAQWWGAKAAEGFFHEFAGLAVFALAMALLVGLGSILCRERRLPQ